MHVSNQQIAQTFAAPSRRQVMSLRQLIPSDDPARPLDNGCLMPAVGSPHAMHNRTGDRCFLLRSGGTLV